MSKQNQNKNRKTGKRNPGKKIIRFFANREVDNRITKVKLVSSGAVTSSAGGVVNTTVIMDPSAAGNWADYSAIYDEFRVLAIRIHIIPNQLVSSVNNDIIGCCYDNDDETALTTMSSVQEYATCHYLMSAWRPSTPVAHVITFERPTTGVDTEVLWRDVGTPSSSRGAIKFYGVNLTASIQYMSFFIEWFAEYRGYR